MKLKRGTVNDEIPTASMADIAFLLIIYFMVTTIFRYRKKTIARWSTRRSLSSSRSSPEESCWSTTNPFPLKGCSSI